MTFLSNLDPVTIIQKLKVMQSEMAHLPTEVGSQKHITLVLQNLHWFPIAFQVQSEVLILTYKILNGLSPMYLRECLLLYALSQSLRSARATSCKHC